MNKDVQFASHLNSRKNSAVECGYTLVELLVTLALLAIFFGMAFPAFDSLIQRSHILSTAVDIRRFISLARSEAVKRSTQVRICNSFVNPACVGTSVSGAKTWSSYLIAFVDTNRNRQYDFAEDKLIKQINIGSMIQVTWNRGDGLMFMPNGFMGWGSNGTFILTAPKGQKLHLVLSTLGRLRSHKP